MNGVKIISTNTLLKSIYCIIITSKEFLVIDEKKEVLQNKCKINTENKLLYIASSSDTVYVFTLSF